YVIIGLTAPSVPWLPAPPADGPQCVQERSWRPLRSQGGRKAAAGLRGLLVFLLTKLDRKSRPCYALGIPPCPAGEHSCVVVSRACCPLPLPTRTVCAQPLIVTACPGTKCGAPRSCWLSLLASARGMSPPTWTAASRPFGEPASAIGGRDWTGCWPMAVRAGRDGRSRSRRCSEPKSLSWAAWDRLPRGCTLRIG